MESGLRLNDQAYFAWTPKRQQIYQARLNSQAIHETHCYSSSKSSTHMRNVFTHSSRRTFSYCDFIRRPPGCRNTLTPRVDNQTCLEQHCRIRTVMGQRTWWPHSVANNKARCLGSTSFTRRQTHGTLSRGSILFRPMRPNLYSVVHDAKLWPAHTFTTPHCRLAEAI